MNHFYPFNMFDLCFDLLNMFITTEDGTIKLLLFKTKFAVIFNLLIIYD